jgi:hypothetical protein
MSFAPLRRLIIDTAAPQNPSPIRQADPPVRRTARQFTKKDQALRLILCLARKGL